MFWELEDVLEDSTICSKRFYNLFWKLDSLPEENLEGNILEENANASGSDSRNFRQRFRDMVETHYQIYSLNWSM